MTTSKRRINSKRVNRLLAGAPLLLLMLGFAGGCETMNPTEDDTLLTGEEVTELIKGNTFRGAVGASQLIMVYFENDLVRGRVGLTGSDTGDWTVNDDIYCHHWVRYFNAKRRCYKWWRRPGDYLLENVDSFRSRNLTGRIEPGRPAGF